eukprot:GEMP01027581.1.p1 GENE.GEMP01027581.1~~GEMP01027581.1.p1  ORF type:complete len:528 (+),score=110.69 GEMP01027581.1:348-1931(+)
MVASREIIANLRKLPVQRPVSRKDVVHESCRIVRQVRAKSNLPPWATANLLSETVKRFRWCKPLEFLLKDLVRVAGNQADELTPRDFARIIWALSLAPSSHATATWDALLINIHTRALHDFSALDRMDILMGLARGPHNPAAREHALRWLLLDLTDDKPHNNWPSSRISSVLWALATLRSDPMAAAHGIALAKQIDINRDFTSPAMFAEGSYALTVLASTEVNADALATRALSLGWPQSFGEQLQANVCFALTHSTATTCYDDNVPQNYTSSSVTSGPLQRFLDTIPLLPVRSARHSACVANLVHRFDQHREALRPHAANANALPPMETLALARALAPLDSALTARLLLNRRRHWDPNDALDAMIIAAQANLGAWQAPRLLQRPPGAMLGIAAWAAGVLGMRAVVYDCVRHCTDVPRKHIPLLCYAAALAQCGNHKMWKEILVLARAAAEVASDQESQTQLALGSLYAYAVHGILSPYLLYECGEMPEQSGLQDGVVAALQRCPNLRYKKILVETNVLSLSVDIVIV